MRQSALFIFILLLEHFSFGQTQDVWIRFHDSTSQLSGYKDVKGCIKIPAKFEGFTRADSFYNIIAVDEKVGSAYKSYYLLKDGRKIGRDSVFIDFTFDCESEGKIIFRDRKKDRVGFFDKNGVAIIPAIYNYVSPFRNGIAIACRNAKRKCWDGGDTTKCEHLGWEGGESILINDKHEILADNITANLGSIDWYSRKENALSIDTSFYVNIKGRNNITYSFVDYDKEFNKWFKTFFLRALRNESTIPNLLFSEVTFWTSEEGWTALKKQELLKTFSKELTPARFDTNKLKTISISKDHLNRFIFESELYRKYLNACGEHNIDKFPMYAVIITNYKKRDNPSQYATGFFREYDTDYQEHFEFLRTEQGYKLLSLSLKK